MSIEETETEKSSSLTMNVSIYVPDAHVKRNPTTRYYDFDKVCERSTRECVTKAETNPIHLPTLSGFTRIPVTAETKDAHATMGTVFSEDEKYAYLHLEGKLDDRNDDSVKITYYTLEEPNRIVNLTNEAEAEELLKQPIPANWCPADGVDPCVGDICVQCGKNKVPVEETTNESNAKDDKKSNSKDDIKSAFDITRPIVVGLGIYVAIPNSKKSSR